MKLFYLVVVCGVINGLPLMSFAQDKVDALLDSGQQRLEDNQQAQVAVSKLHDETADLVEEYQSLLKVVDGLKVYNKILAKQLGNQESEMQKLDASIANAAVIERQILPLLTRMLDGLQAFIALDLPFLTQERQQRVANLRNIIEKSELSNAEKTRRVFEAFQIENDFGNTIETYKGKLSLEGRTFDVDYLRIGRIALTYRTVGGDAFGYWDGQQKKWLPLTESSYQRNIDKGIKMARQEMAPELITIPVLNNQESL